MADLKNCDNCRKTYRDFLKYEGKPELPPRKRFDATTKAKDVFLRIFILADDLCPDCLANVLVEVASDLRKGLDDAAVQNEAD